MFKAMTDFFIFLYYLKKNKLKQNLSLIMEERMGFIFTLSSIINISQKCAMI